MSTATLAPPAISFTPKTLRWTCPEFHDLCDAGRFEGRNVILVDGEILEMPQPNPPHNSGVELTREILALAFGPGHWIRVQMALDLALDIDPGPDVAVIVGTARTVTHQPTGALLVVEVSDSTLAYDSGAKVNLYAEGGIAEYCVLDLNGRQLLVWRDPVADPLAPRGHRYATRQTLLPTNAISPLAAPSASIRVADLLP